MRDRYLLQATDGKIISKSRFELIHAKDEEPTCINKVSPIKNIANIKINDETFQLKYNREYNILQDTYNISLEKCIIPVPITYGH